MYRMHKMALKISPILLLGALAQSAHAASPATPAPTEAFADKFGETPEAIQKLPYIVGDPETQRRDLILKAYELRVTDKAATRNPKRLAQLDEYLRAADRIRSSTFTRCNLGLVAHHRGDIVRAAEHFQRERAQPLPKDASDADKGLRHACEIYAALAYERVGMLKIAAPNASVVWVNHRMVGTAPVVGYVFVKPNEEQTVRIVLDDESELRKKVVLEAGQSTTLEFQSVKPKEPVREPAAVKENAPGVGPVREQAAMKQDVMVEPRGGGWKRDMMIGGTVMAGVGLGALIGTSIWKMVAKSKLPKTQGTNPPTCEKRTDAPYEPCLILQNDMDTADILGLISTGVLGIGLTGIGIYLFSPQSPSPSPVSSPTFKAKLPTGLGIQGAF